MTTPHCYCCEALKLKNLRNISAGHGGVPYAVDALLRRTSNPHASHAIL